jgi:hypothetical protein
MYSVVPSSFKNRQTLPLVTQPNTADSEVSSARLHDVVENPQDLA